MSTTALAFAQRPNLQAAVERSTRQTRVDAFDRALRRVMDEYRIPGAVAGVSTPGVRPWLAARGLADVASGRPMTLQDHFQIRSVTKSFTVTVVLELARARRLSLGDTLAMYVPGVPNGDQITLAELAGMRSGVKNYTQVAAFIEAFVADPARQWTDAELVGLATPESPVFEPGEQYDYSNTNTVLLGMVVEKVTGRPLGQALGGWLLAPLELSSTRYPPSFDARRPAPTPYQVDPATGDLEELPQANLSSLGPSGAIVTTLPDLLRWGRALGTGRLIGPRLLQLREGLATPATNGPEYERYGLGVGELKGWWGHSGDGFGFQAATFYDPATRTTIAVALNSTQPEHVAVEIFKALADVVRTR
ncbi:serine hydrolase domain-containing protein [Paludisphaera soli]|uniref:serine hydrolase domain-containing protein n=1 Tax=Paludisphaera soli TaxID=2712865 RepID=UPI001F113537|nr:beta-lactamase family protein [Paludisphaera soli]